MLFSLIIYQVGILNRTLFTGAVNKIFVISKRFFVGLHYCHNKSYKPPEMAQSTFFSNEKSTLVKPFCKPYSKRKSICLLISDKLRMTHDLSTDCNHQNLDKFINKQIFEKNMVWRPIFCTQKQSSNKNK